MDRLILCNLYVEKTFQANINYKSREDCVSERYTRGFLTPTLVDRSDGIYTKSCTLFRPNESIGVVSAISNITIIIDVQSDSIGTHAR